MGSTPPKLVPIKLTPLPPRYVYNLRHGTAQSVLNWLQREKQKKYAFACMVNLGSIIQQASAECEHLEMSEEVVLPARIQGETVVCSNGHRYRFEDFNFSLERLQTRVEDFSDTNLVLGYSFGAQNPTKGTNTVATYRSEQHVPITESVAEEHFGCPTCRSTAYSFESSWLSGYSVCARPLLDEYGNRVWNGLVMVAEYYALQGLPDPFCLHAYSKEYCVCPLCDVYRQLFRSYPHDCLYPPTNWWFHDWSLFGSYWTCNTCAATRVDLLNSPGAADPPPCKGGQDHEWVRKQGNWIKSTH